MNDIPISDASFTEVMARVAFRTIHLFRRRYDYETDHQSAIMLAVHLHLQNAGFDALAIWVRAYHYHWTPLYHTVDIRNDFILRSRTGHTWRSVVYPPYKRTRRDPRVTNRGVASPRLSEEG